MARSSQSAEVDQTVTKNGGTVTTSPFRQMLNAMALSATLEDETSAFSGDDVNDILTAKSLDEMWDADERGPLNFQHLAGCDLGITDFHVKWSRGNNDQMATPFIVEDPKTRTNRKMYLLVDLFRTSDEQDNNSVKLPTVGERFQVNTSARFVAAKIWRAGMLGEIDAEQGKTLFCYVRSTDLGGGQAVIKLRPPRIKPAQATLAE